MNKKIDKKNSGNQKYFLEFGSLIHNLKTGLLEMKIQLEQDALFAIKL